MASAHNPIMGVADRVVCRVLQSPAHRLMSGSICAIRYRGRRSGTTYSTPTQFASHGDGLVIFVGRADTKTWWRNFREDRELDVLVAGEWRAMVGRAVLDAVEPDAFAPLMEGYLLRFPKAPRLLESTDAGSGHGHAVVVFCRPR